MPCGSVCEAMLSIVDIASLELVPGAGEPLISAARNRLKCVITAGAVVDST